MSFAIWFKSHCFRDSLTSTKDYPKQMKNLKSSTLIYFDSAISRITDCFSWIQNTGVKYVTNITPNIIEYY